MALTLVPHANQNVVGPGVPIQVTSTLPSSSFPPPVTMVVDFFLVSAPTTRVDTIHISNWSQSLIVPMLTSAAPSVIAQPLAVTQETAITAQLTAQSSTGTFLDTGTSTTTWDLTAGERFIPQQTTGGGLTTEQALQLQQTQQATWPQFLVDELGLTLLGTGSSGFPINATLEFPVFAVIVRLTRVPEDLAPQTPDDNYWVKTLAVVRIFRGSDLWLRIPIHTSSKMINLWVEGLALGLMDAVLSAGWLLNLTLQTSFLPGVEGQVLLMRTP